jgi:hypothetical protein
MAVAAGRIRPATTVAVPTGWPRVLWVIGTVLLVTMVVHIAALVITGGPVSGPVSLRKPATFAETGWLRQLPLKALIPLTLTALGLCAIALLATYVIVGTAVLKSAALPLAGPRSRLE